ncbi:hypothetical protein JOB18_016373 [Solea senegalensis]|uniref:Uncharacterized protein n=1 Tax=Solea senegalensis TaxID=28829 RepID=A0AAV6SFD8_SOLSE|nr:hypothetical protein JOB18_016373 [Solea senegalensis]
MEFVDYCHDVPRIPTDVWGNFSLQSSAFNLQKQLVSGLQGALATLVNAFEHQQDSDALMGNLPDGGTQVGHLIVLMGKEGRFSSVCWQSKRIRRVVRNTLAGETLALADGIDNAIFLSSLYSELTTGKVSQDILPAICVTDNYSLVDAIKSTKSVTEKQLRLQISGIKELIQSKDPTCPLVSYKGTAGRLSDKKGCFFPAASESAEGWKVEPWE